MVSVSDCCTVNSNADLNLGLGGGGPGSESPFYFLILWPCPITLTYQPQLSYLSSVGISDSPLCELWVTVAVPCLKCEWQGESLVLNVGDIGSSPCEVWVTLAVLVLWLWGLNEIRHVKCWHGAWHQMKNSVIVSTVKLFLETNSFFIMLKKNDSLDVPKVVLCFFSVAVWICMPNKESGIPLPAPPKYDEHSRGVLNHERAELPPWQ